MVTAARRSARRSVSSRGGLARIGASPVDPFVDLDGVTEADLDVGSESAAIFVDEADGDDHDAADSRFADRAKRDTRRAGLERHQRGLEVHLTFGEDRDVGAGSERDVTGLERRVIVAGVGPVAAAMDRDDAA